MKNCHVKEGADLYLVEGRIRTNGYKLQGGFCLDSRRNILIVGLVVEQFAFLLSVFGGLLAKTG